MCKLRHFILLKILIQIYYSIIFPFLTYGVVIWGNTYQTNLYPLVTIQKRAVRIISFSHFQTHTSELFKKFNLLKFMDIIKPYTATFMYQFHKGLLNACTLVPTVFLRHLKTKCEFPFSFSVFLRFRKTEFKLLFSFSVFLRRRKTKFEIVLSYFVFLNHWKIELRTSIFTFRFPTT